MTERDFCYWLQGFFELTVQTSLTEWQVKMIKEHLDKVFNQSKAESITTKSTWIPTVFPSYNPPFTVDSNPSNPFMQDIQVEYDNPFGVVMPENMPTC